MAYNNLQDYISKLRELNELVEVTDFINPTLEITEVADRFSKQETSHNKAILFTNTGTDFPVFINGFGSETRINIALSTKNLHEPQERIESLLKSALSPKQDIWDKLKMLPLLSELNSWMPKHKKGRGACQEIIQKEVDIEKLPILQCWPHDGGKFITFPMVITQHPETGNRNVGMYRMQVISKNSTAMHWHLHKTGANHYNAYKTLGKRMPIAVALGGDPSHTFSATAPLPENIDEFMLSGFLRKKHVELVKCITNDLEVPNDADFVIEGYIDTSEEKFYEGPFGDHTGFYSLPDFYPIFHITCITHKKNAIYPTTIVGIPPMEDAWIGKATERIFLAPIKFLLVPELIDYWMPFEGVAHNLVIAKIKKTYPGQALKVMNTLWGAGQMMFNKTLIIVDEDCEFENPNEIIKAIVTNCNPSSDILISKGPLDVLDHAAPQTGFGSKIGFDATKKLPEEISKTNHKNCNYLLVPKALEDSNEVLIKNISTKITAQTFIIIYDNTIDTNDFQTISWHVLNNINPLQDCKIENINTYDCYVIDGTTKLENVTNRDWPTPVISDDTTINKINEIWNKIYPSKILISPSEKYKKLSSKNSAWLYSHNKKTQ